MSDETKRLLDKAVQKSFERTTFHGLLGKHNPDDTIDYEVPGRVDYLYVTMPGGTVIIARNKAGVAQTEDMQVELRSDHGTWVITGRSTSGGLSVPTPTPPSGVLPHDLALHTDVSDVAPASGDVLQFSDFDGLWSGVPVNALGLTLDDLNGVTAPSPANGDVLTYSGGDWVNGATIPTAVAATIHGATPKATPVGADELGYLNSAASFALVKMTFTQLLAYLAIPTLPVKATGAEVDTGTDDAKFVTPKAMEDSSYIKAAYADAKVADAINDGTTTIAPSQNAVFDALALKIATSVLDTDVTLAANSDAKIPSQKAIKTYVDAIAQGLDIKGSVRVATTANITLSGTQTIDGVAVIAGDRVLVKDQTLGANNGIYVVAAGAWARSTDADSSAKVTAGMFTFASEGTVNGDNGFALTTNDPIVLATTVLAFTQVSGAGQIIAGNALTKTGNQLDWVPDGATLEVSSDQGRVKDAGITNAKLATMPDSTVKGVAVGSGTSAPVNLTAAQLTAIIETATLYLLLLGRSGGQTAIGGTASGNNLALQSTSHATKGKVIFGASAINVYDEVNERWGFGTASPAQLLHGKSASADANARLETASASNYAGLLIYDSAGLLTFAFQYGNASAAALASEAFFATRQSGIPMSFYQGGVASSNLRIALPGSGGNTVIGGLTSAGASVLGVKAGASSNDAAVGGVLYETTTQGFNTLTGEDDLASYLVPADTLHVNGQSLWFEAFGTFANNGNNKRIRVQFTAGSGTTLVFDLGSSGSFTGQSWYLRGRIIRTGAATQKAAAGMTTGPSGGGTGNAANFVTTALNQTLSGAITLKVTGEATATSDILLESFIVGYDDANT